MNSQGFFTFSAGCAINLDDIGEFPDYFEIAEKLTLALDEGKIDEKLACTFLDAELEDVQHIPNFLILLKSLIKHQEQLTHKANRLLQILSLKYLLSAFTSFSMDEN